MNLADAQAQGLVHRHRPTCPVYALPWVLADGRTICVDHHWAGYGCDDYDMGYYLKEHCTPRSIQHPRNLKSMTRSEFWAQDPTPEHLEYQLMVVVDPLG